MKYPASLIELGEKNSQEERNNATNQIVADYSHEERLCDSTVIESKARRRHIVMTSRYGEAKWRARDRPRTIAMTTTGTSTGTTNMRHGERGGFDDPSRRRERGYAPRTAKTGVRRYGFERIACC